MSTAMFFKRPEYCEYVRLLAELHDLIAAEQDEGYAGERLRDQMDTCSADFSDEEIASLNGISGDLYSLIELPLAPCPRTALVQDDLWHAIHARQSGDHITALALLRRNRTMIEPSQLAYLRGRIFSDAGLVDIAIRFFEKASEIEPADEDYRFVVLDSLKRFDPARAQKMANKILGSECEHPAKVVLKAAEIRFESTRDMAREEVAAARREMVPLFEKIVVALESSGNGSESQSLLPLAYALCGFCFQDADKIPEARRCFDEALRLDPNNDALWTARGILLYGHDSSQAAANFSEAVGLRPRFAWPYLFLAHYYLAHGRYEACLAMCEKAIRFPSTDRARANCYEWMAICQAMLAFDPQTVRSSFQRARRLAPESDRIGRNEDAFERSLQQPLADAIAWEKGNDVEVIELAKSEFPPVFGLAA